VKQEDEEEQKDEEDEEQEQEEEEKQNQTEKEENVVVVKEERGNEAEKKVEGANGSADSLQVGDDSDRNDKEQNTRGSTSDEETQHLQSPGHSLQQRNVHELGGCIDDKMLTKGLADGSDMGMSRLDCLLPEGTGEPIKLIHESEHLINMQLEQLRRKMKTARLEIQCVHDVQERNSRLAVFQQLKTMAQHLYDQKQDLINERMRLIQIEQEMQMAQEEQEVDDLLDKALRLNVDEEVKRQIKPVAKAAPAAPTAPPIAEPSKTSVESMSIQAGEAAGAFFAGMSPQEITVRETNLARLRAELAAKRRDVEQLHAERQKQRQEREEQQLLEDLQQVEAEAEQLRRRSEQDGIVSGSEQDDREGGSENLMQKQLGTDLVAQGMDTSASQQQTERSMPLSSPLPDSGQVIPDAVDSVDLSLIAPISCEHSGVVAKQESDERPTHDTALSDAHSPDLLSGRAANKNESSDLHLSTGLQVERLLPASDPSTQTTEPNVGPDVADHGENTQSSCMREWENINEEQEGRPIASGQTLPVRSVSCKAQRQNHLTGLLPGAQVDEETASQDETSSHGTEEPMLRQPTPISPATLVSDLILDASLVNAESKAGNSEESPDTDTDVRQSLGEKVQEKHQVELRSSSGNMQDQDSEDSDAGHHQRGHRVGGHLQQVVSRAIGSDTPAAKTAADAQKKEPCPAQPLSPPLELQNQDCTPSLIVPENLKRSQEQLFDAISADILDTLLGEIWDERRGRSQQSVVQRSVGRQSKHDRGVSTKLQQAPAEPPAPSVPQVVDTSDAFVSLFLDTAFLQLGVTDENAKVATPLQPVETWLPSVLHIMQRREGSTSEAGLPGAKPSGRERDVISFARLLADTLVEVACEEVKLGPRSLGWRRPGFGEPPLSRYWAKEASNVHMTSSQQNWRRVRTRVSESVKCGCKFDSGDNDGAGTAGNLDSDGHGLSLMNIDEGIDALLEEEICSDEISWLDTTNEERLVKNQVANVIFAELIEEMISEMQEIWPD